jgi:hypothetical protein
MGFTCALCGSYHDQELLDVRFAKPDALLGLGSDPGPDVYWAEDADFAADWTANRHFMRALLEVPVGDAGDVFAWGIWVELSREDAEDAASEYEAGDGLAYAGRLATSIVGYPDTLGLDGTVTLRGDVVAAFELDAVHHPLERDQRDGISLARARELAEPYRR